MQILSVTFVWKGKKVRARKKGGKKEVGHIPKLSVLQELNKRKKGIKSD